MPRWGPRVALLALALGLAGWPLKLVPGMNQPNLAILLLAMPAHLGAWWAVRRWAPQNPTPEALAGNTP